MGVCHSYCRLFESSYYRQQELIQIFNKNITYQPSKKTNFLCAFFTVFFMKQQIYEAIAAIFWQFASYVMITCERRIRKKLN